MSRITKEEAIERLVTLNYLILDESKFETTNSRVQIQCLTHGLTWVSTVGEAYRKAKYCKQCKPNKTWEEIAQDKEYSVIELGDVNATFKCPNGHEWTTKKHNIAFTSCKICSGKKIPIDTIIEKIISRGFEFLNIDEITSTRCVGSYKCPKGHEWKCYVHNVYSEKSGCPHCSTTSGERRCRFILETIFCKPFTKTRSVVDDGLELDMYNEELRIACEYNGIHHYKEDAKFFHKYGGFEGQQERDQKKSSFCEINDIRLIVVPYTLYSFQETVKYILDLLEVDVEIDWKSKEIEFNSSVDNNILTSAAMQSEWDTVAAAKGGQYVTCHTNGKRAVHKFICANGHEFSLQASDVRRGRWCWDCSGRKPLSIDVISDKLASIGMETSSEFVKSSDTLALKCNYCESVYTNIWDNIKQRELKNGCCRECKASKNKLEKIQDKLSDLGLSFTGTLFLDAKTKYTWVCLNGHETIGNWNAIKVRKVGCKECTT